MSRIKPFGGLLGNNATLRTLEFLLPHENLEFNVSELAEFVDVARQTMSQIVKSLTDHGLLVPASRTRNATNYRINADSPFFKVLIDLSNRYIVSILDDETLDEIEAYWASKPRPPLAREPKPKRDIKPDYSAVEPPPWKPESEDVLLPWQKQSPHTFPDTGIVQLMGLTT